MKQSFKNDYLAITQILFGTKADLCWSKAYSVDHSVRESYFYWTAMKNGE